MNLKLYEDVYNVLKLNVQRSSKFSPNVLKKPIGEDYPKVVFEEISNTSLSSAERMESYSLIGFQVDIYTKDIVLDGVRYDAMEVARELQLHVAECLEYTFSLKRIMAQPTPNLDDTLYRITMRYNGNASDYRGHFF